MTSEERKMKREVFWYKAGSIGKELACALRLKFNPSNHHDDL
jgi:hypothetical protein